MIFCFDIDNTICKTKGKNYKNAKPHKDVVKIINKLYDNGHIIKIFTARFMGRNNDNIKLACELAIKMNDPQALFDAVDGCKNAGIDLKQDPFSLDHL